MPTDDKRPAAARGLFLLITLMLSVVWSGCGYFRTAPAGNTPATQGTIDTPEIRKLTASIAAAGDYLIRNQLSNGELPYKVDITDGNRRYSPSHIRLIAATGALYTVCRVTGDPAYGRAGDRALACYLERLIEDEDKFEGACLYSKGYCKLGGAALAIDAVYRRWQAIGDTRLEGRDLLAVARRLGEHLVWMCRSAGGFYHRLDPYDGIIDGSYYVRYFNGEALMALLELYEMTGEAVWLEQALGVNAYMKQQPVTGDHWHAYAFRLLARLDALTTDDRAYAEKIARAVVDDMSDLDLTHGSISTATRMEALAAVGLALQDATSFREWLAPAIRRHADFVMARQLPRHLCHREIPDGIIQLYRGGIYHSCRKPYIRVDALQHWINGAALFLECLGCPALTGRP